MDTTSVCVLSEQHNSLDGGNPQPMPSDEEGSKTEPKLLAGRHTHTSKLDDVTAKVNI